METSYQHLPVMCEQVVSLLAPVLDSPNAVMVDATIGLGGHTLAALERFTSLRVIGFDRDPQAIEATQNRLVGVGDRLEIHQTNFDQIREILDGQTVDAILFDLGLSSLQIDSPDRGFAYSFDAPLSMRMDDGPGLTAADIVNTYSAKELTGIFAGYGEEKHAAKIALAILEARQSRPFTSSAQLVDVITASIPFGRSRSGHPAKRVFQALRMEVNDEQSALSRTIPAALECLKLSGRVAILSYHSGEDRIVKRAFLKASLDQVPPHIAVVPKQYQAQFRLVTSKAIKASPEETMQNPRSKSARLRVIERIKPKP